MVKIRLKRQGAKHRPFYRIVVSKSTAARDGAFIEIIGTYDPLPQPSVVTLKKDRAMHWLMEGAQPTETVGYLLKREGVLEEFFEKRPKAKEKYKYLDKAIGAMSKKSVLKAPAAEESAPEPKKEEEPKAKGPVAEEPKAEEPQKDEAAAEATS